MATHNWARAERLALCDLLAEFGPDAPTLCQGWTAGDLAAHLLIRERRPDAGPGILIPVLAGYTERIQNQVRRSTPFPKIVEQLRQGPPGWSLFGLPGMDAALNIHEYFVHHEDLLRAPTDWKTRDIPADEQEQLWKRLKMSRFTLRRLPVAITLVEPGGRTQQVTRNGRQARVHGLPSELALWVSGRKDVAKVELTGEAEAVHVLSQGRWRL